MTRTDAVTLLTYRLGNRTDLEARIILEMTTVQEFILEGTGSFLPWFLETEIATATTVASEERVPVPEDFLGEIEDQALWLYDSESEKPWKELIKNDYDLLKQKYLDEGRPEQYALGGDYFLLAPVPDDAYTLKMRYYAKDTSVAASTDENKWLKHAADLVLAETGKVMARHLMNPGLEAAFEKDATVARERLYRKHEARRHANRTYSMGEN